MASPKHLYISIYACFLLGLLIKKIIKSTGRISRTNVLEGPKAMVGLGLHHSLVSFILQGVLEVAHNVEHVDLYKNNYVNIN